MIVIFAAGCGYLNIKIGSQQLIHADISDCENIQYCIFHQVCVGIFFMLFGLPWFTYQLS